MEHSANECASANKHPSFPAKFPPELLERIVIHFIRDPHTTFHQLKSLRLVCRIFSDVVGRRVLSRVRLFQRVADTGFRPPLSIISSELNRDICEASTLVVDWNTYFSTFIPIQEMRNLNQWVVPILCNLTLAPLTCLLTFIFCPPTLPLNICNSINLLRSRYRLSRASSSVSNTPNVHRVIWNADNLGPIQSWVASSIGKLLLGFNQLSELVLLINRQQNLSRIFKYCSKLRNLRKLKIRFSGHRRRSHNQERLDPINDIGKVIASNPDLTHLELDWMKIAEGSFSTIFSHVPANGPLKLEHFALSTSPSDVRAIVPHLRSLTSIDLRSASAPCPLLVQVLHDERIFPPTIRTSHVDDHLIAYLNHHPRIVSLSIHTAFNEVFGRKILQVMVLHSESLTYFGTYSSSFISCLQHLENELLLLQCTKLEQLLLKYDYRDTRWDLISSPKLPETFIAHLPIIARLPSSLTLVNNHFKLFEACIAHCSQSEDPLIRDLTGCFVYEYMEIFMVKQYGVGL